jgi:hypothetical protein
VWLALSEIANEGGSNHITPTREVLSKMTGIQRLQTVSDALTALSQARWAKIEHVPVTENHRQVGTVLEIKLLHRRNENRCIGRNAERQAKSHSRSNENRCIAKQRSEEHTSELQSLS